MNNNYYPRTIFEIEDNSAIPQIVKTPLDKPVYLIAFASSKGTEEMTKSKGEEFYKRYGKDINFFKYGQALLTASSIIDAGGTVLAKRVVADDATLANLSVIANVKSTQVQKTNEKGQPLYIDKSTKEETTNAGDGNQPLMIKKVTVKYEVQTTAGAKSLKEVVNSVSRTLNTTGSVKGEFVYPIYTFTDVGRGVSLKRVSLHPNYSDSKYTDYMKYNLVVRENNTVLEDIPFAFNTDIIEKGKNLSLQSMVPSYSEQIQCKVYEANIEMLFAKIAELTGKKVEDLKQEDILFGCQKNSPSSKIDWLEIDRESANLSHIYGIDLDSGTNGKFGDFPLTTENYKQELVKFFGGKFTSDIYDTDNYKIDLVADCNYPDEVKREIEKLADFRGDFFYLRDLGTDVYTLQQILEKDKPSLKSRCSATYELFYDIIEPFSKKQVTVTSTYSMAKLLVDHFDKGRSRPVAGQLYNMIITEAIKGTENFIPKVTPTCDEKQILADANINYASYYDGILTVETLYTSQEKRTQLSYINNVFAIQEIIKAVRTKCPKNRYSFIEGKDLDKYKQDVQEVLDNYTANFSLLKMKYIEDPTKIANKIFYAAIQVRFKNFEQTEWFKIEAIN